MSVLKSKLLELLVLCGLLTLSCSIIAVERLAEQRNLMFDRVGTELGLSQGIVTSFVQDLRGYIWIGTQEGLNRYDGFKFETYYHLEEDENSLTHDTIWALLVDQKGVLWIGTDSGLNVFDQLTQSFQLKSLGSKSKDVDRVVHVLLEDIQGNVWVGTDNGLVKITPEGTTYSFSHSIDEMLMGSIRAITETASGQLWIGTETSGLYRYDRPSDGFISVRISTENQKITRDLHIRDLVEDQKGLLWIGTFNNGLVRFDPKTESAVKYSEKGNEGLGSDRIRSLLIDQNGDLWSGSDRGLHLWNADTERFTRYEVDLTDPRSLSDNTILDIYQDRGGVVWVGTYNGVNKFNAMVEMFPYFRRPETSWGSSPSNNITSFAESENGDVWVGTLSGLMYWDSVAGELVATSAEKLRLSDRRVMSLGVVGDEIWVGTINAGVNVVTEGRVEKTYKHNPVDLSSLSSNAITKIYRDAGGNTWVATYGGGVNFYLGDNRFRRYPDPSNLNGAFSDMRCIDIAEDEIGNIWIATDGGGVIILNPRSGDTRVLYHNPNDSNSLASNNNLSLLRTVHGMWVGSVDRGLSLVDPELQKFTRITKADGLASDAVYGLLEDGAGNIWISGGKGLTVMDPARNSFNLFDSTHGLQSSDFNSGAYGKLSDGSLVFGGNNGFNAFYPERIRLNDHVPSVQITNFKLFNESVRFNMPLDELGRIDLNYDDSVISFSFAAIDYTAPKKNQYRYKLDGFDRDWVEHQGSREVTYTNLDAGSYVFRVQGSNNDGVWNREGASLSLLVHPAPWLTWWAYGIYISLVVLGFFMLLRYNSERLRRDAERRYSERLQLYIESLEEASDSILIADSKGILMYANNTIADGLNRSPSEVIGESIWSVLFEEEKDIEAARNALRFEGRFHGEVELERISGARMTHEVTIAAVQQSSSNELAYVGISRDVTERKITEAELEDYRKNLERIVEERTEELQKEIAENKAIQVHLANSLDEKELLIKEVHHRVKNNMQVISSLLSIQAEGAGDEVYFNMLNESQQRIKSMALIHETLYQSEDLLRIDFQEYIETLTTSLNRSYSVPGVSVHVDVKVENVLLDLETAVPCGLVINELVSNSLKHAFHGKQGVGVIDINFVTNDSSYDLRIADNGIGLPDDFDPTKSISMGMEIVSILTKQLEGELSSYNDNGAVFEIKFPKSVDV